MGALTLSLLLIGACVGLFIQSLKIKELNEKIKNIPPPIPDINLSTDPFGQSEVKRRGIIKKCITQKFADGGEKDHHIIVEVEEIEKLANDMSRIKVIKTSGSGHMPALKYAGDTTPEIIKTEEITFL